MRVHVLCVPAGMTLLFAFSAVHAQSNDISKAFQLQPREEFPLELPKMCVSVDEETQEFSGVRITFPPDYEDQVFIGMGDDLYIKNSSRGREKVLYRELPEKVGYISKFEAKHIIKVNEYFVSALEVLDNLLQKNSWGRCLYFDAFFPHFLSGYYSMVCAAQNSLCALPIGVRIPEREFDVSLSSPKTDARINRWRASQDTIIKLRIATKELTQQLKGWKKYLDKAKNDEGPAAPKELEDALVAFVRVYFGLKPASPVVRKRTRL
jgi:hypothetical protein